MIYKQLTTNWYRAEDRQPVYGDQVLVKLAHGDFIVAAIENGFWHEPLDVQNYKLEGSLWSYLPHDLKIDN